MRPTPQAKPRSSACLIALIVGFLAPLALPASAATVATDTADYAPRATAVTTRPGVHAARAVRERPETCTATSATCPADTGARQPAGTVCRAAVNECDVAETCTGTSTTCPTDAFAPSSTACTSLADSNPCTTDVCSGTSATCTHPAGNAGATCRAAAGECDAVETCTGTSTTCPSDTKKPSGTACTADTNPCTLDQCNGTSNSCQHPAGNAGAQCRAAADECDLAENCTGTSTTCPTDLKKAAGATCTPDSNPCTLDQCNGSSNSCQHPAGNAGAACPDDGDPCTTDTCDGTNTGCQHPPGNAGAAGRAAANDCDVEEECPVPPIIGFRAAATASSGTASSATSLSLSRPSGTLANDVMLASITAHGSSAAPTITSPSGWTEIVNTFSNGQNLRVATYYKVAGTAAADPGPYLFSVTSSRVAGGISAYFNVDTSNPINASGGAASSSTPSLTTTVYNTILVACFGRSDNKVVGHPSGMTERFNVESSSSGGSTADASSERAAASQATLGSTGSKASTTGGPNMGTAQISQLIALAPPSSSCGPDTVKPAGTSCTEDDNPCTTDVCNGTAGAH